MHGESKIDRRRALRKLDDVSGRREDEDLVLVEVQLEELEELVGRLGVHLQLEHLAEPGEVPIELVATVLDALVAPVSGDSVIRGPMHLAGPDLDFEQLSPWAEYRGMQRLVSVRLRLRDVILDPLLKRREGIMDDARGGIMVRHRFPKNQPGTQTHGSSAAPP